MFAIQLGTPQNKVGVGRIGLDALADGDDLVVQVAVGDCDRRRKRGHKQAGEDEATAGPWRAGPIACCRGHFSVLAVAVFE